MHDPARVAMTAVVLLLAPIAGGAHADEAAAVAAAGMPVVRTGAAPRSAASAASGGATAMPIAQTVPCKPFTNAPEKPHDPSKLVFGFDQLEHFYRVPGEFTHRLSGDAYGFESLSFIITDTRPGGGPGLHVHDTEEAHVLLQGTAQYVIGDKTFTVNGPYVAKVPAGVPHTFINSGTEPFRLVAVLASKHPSTERIGPNPLVVAWQARHGEPPCRSAE